MDAASWDERYRASELVWSAGPNAVIAGEAGELPPGRALDVAAGEGRNAIWLAERGWTVTAADFSAVALEKGRRLAEARGEAVAQRISWVCTDVRDYRPPTTFDLVLLAYLHLPAAELQGVFAHVAAAVSRAGVLLVVGHDRTNIVDGVGGPQDPDILYGPDDLCAHLPANLGFEVERAERVRRRVEGQGEAIDVVMRARRSRTGP